MLTVITDKDEIDAAQHQLRKQLQAQATKRGRVTFGFFGGSLAANASWFKDLNFWYAYEPLDDDGRHWNAFGYGNPFNQTVSLTVEVNPPYEGLRRDVAGAFVKDEIGTVYLIHRGKIGGGRKGIGKRTFLPAYPEPLEIVADGNRKTEVIVLGVVGSDSLIAQVEHFVQIVQTFKDATVRKSSGWSASIPLAANSHAAKYADEFEGTKVFDTKRRIVAVVTHGIVVRHLKEAVESLGYKVASDQARDLYVPGSGAKVHILFEVKTDVSTTTVYTAIGQLLFHGGTGASDRLIAVLPDGVERIRGSRLAALGIRTVTYVWNGNRPCFSGLSAALKM